MRSRRVVPKAVNVPSINALSQKRPIGVRAVRTTPPDHQAVSRDPYDEDLLYIAGIVRAAVSLRVAAACVASVSRHVDVSEIGDLVGIGGNVLHLAITI